MQLRALLIDYNGFFASCERQERPELRDSPVGVTPTSADTTCVIAASYDARKHGVKVGTSVTEAKRLCPDIVLVESRPEVYIRYHHKLLEAVNTCLPVTEVWSIDEVWCELPPSWRNRSDALALAHKMKAAIARIAGAHLTCSIGISGNPWLAKIASEMQKPDGLVLLEKADLPDRLFELALRDLPGIGPNLHKRLRQADIETVQALYACTSAQLRAIWGSVEGARMWERLRGHHVPLSHQKTASIGHSHVLPPDLRNPAGAEATLHRLLQKAAMRLRAVAHFSGGIHIALRFRGDGTRWSTAATFVETQDTRELTRVLRLLWKRRPNERRDITGAGVSLFNLLPASMHTGMLPGIVDNGDRRIALNTALDHINRKLGKNTVVYGGALGALEYAPVRIAFTRIPDLKIEDPRFAPSDDELAKAKAVERVTGSKPEPRAY